MKKPSFKVLWDNFPTHGAYFSMKDLFSHLGGNAEQNIYSPGFGPNGNTCASRISVALNASLYPVDGALCRAIGVETLGTNDGRRIIFRVRGLKRYLNEVLGAPVSDLNSPFDDSFAGKKGIIAFDVNWSDASGHIALWDGSRYREPSYDDYSEYGQGTAVFTKRAEFWEL